MTLRLIVKFFFNNLDFKDCLKIILNYFLIFLALGLEIIFITLFFLILNQQQEFTKNVFLKEFISEFQILFGIDSSIKLYIQLLIISLVLKNLIHISQNYFFFRFIYNLTKKNAVNFFNFCLQQRYEQFLKKNTSIYIKNIIRDNENIFVGILGMLLSVVGELIYMSVIIFFSLSLISLIITYEEIFLVLIVLFLIIFLLKLSSKYGLVRSNNETSAFKLLNESFLIFKEIKLSGKAQQFVEKFDRYINRYYTSKAIHGVINISPKIIFEFGLLIFFYLNFLNSGLNIIDYISKFAVLVLIALRILPSFSKVSSNLAGVFYNLESLKLIYNDLNKKNLPSSFVINAKTKSQLVLKNINLKKISHKFTNEDKTIHILKDFNYEFKIGKMYGIYGKSGLGKSTLLEIISGLIIPEKGKVYVNAKKKHFLELYKTFNLSFLSQNPKIMDDNLISNLTLNFNHKKKDLEKIIFLLKKFNLNKFANLSFLNEKSPLSIKKLSGGEIQRISFIRSIFYDSDILLLDEPTAALDQANERTLFSYLQSIKKDKIIIVTSHKNQLIKYFDKVINLEKVNAK